MNLIVDLHMEDAYEDYTIGELIGGVIEHEVKKYVTKKVKEALVEADGDIELAVRKIAKERVRAALDKLNSGEIEL